MSDVTIYTLAKELNMTPSMVSRALNPEGKISEEKRKMVLAVAEKYHFRPNRFASRLSMKPIRIGVLICSKFKINSDKMIEGIRISHDELKDYKIEYDVSVFDSSVSDGELSRILDRYQNADGFVLSGMSSARFTAVIDDLYAKKTNVVQVQSLNEEARTLFGSKHNERVASGIAADFLQNCLGRMPRKNLLLFTGDLASSIHANAASAFAEACRAAGMTLLATVDMKDDADYLRSLLPRVFGKYKEKVDGIYITSGVSLELCRYIEENGIDIPLVAFDTYGEIKRYMEKGIISAAISQNVTKQMKVAFEALVRHIMTGKEYPPVLYTDVNLMLKSNMHQFD